MTRNDGFDLLANGVKVASIQTSLQGDGTREMYVFLPDGGRLHFGAQVIENIIGRSFARVTDPNASGGIGGHVGPGLIREQRSTGELAQFLIERAAGGEMRMSFTQGDYQTQRVGSAGLAVSRPSKSLPWPAGSKSVRYGVALYDAWADVQPSASSELTVQYSSDSTGMGFVFTVANVTS